MRDGGWWAQKADPDDIQIAATYTDPFYVNNTCQAAYYDGYFLSDVYMEIFELDKPDSHDVLAALHYLDTDVALSCSDSWTCSGQSDWLWPVAVTPVSSKVDAQIRVAISTRRGTP